MGGQVECVQFDKPHNYDRDSREKMYGWMNKHLRNLPGAEHAREGDVAAESPGRLKALGSLSSNLVGLDGAPACFRARYSYADASAKSRVCRVGGSDRARQILRGLLGESGPGLPAPVMVRGRSSVGDFRVEKVLIESEPDDQIPVWVIEREGRVAGRGRPVVVIVRPEGKRALLRDRRELVRGLLDADVSVLAVDARLRGELRRRWEWNSVIWGRPEAGMAAHDLAAVAAYARSMPGIDA